eukprot:8670629-Alexandrium_andersonii.AAC.1
MSASLVGSEMCIRDSFRAAPQECLGCRAGRRLSQEVCQQDARCRDCLQRRGRDPPLLRLPAQASLAPVSGLWLAGGAARG